MFSPFQGKFIRINFDASGYIAGANIGKKDFTFIFTSRETPMSHFILNLCPLVGLCVQEKECTTLSLTPEWRWSPKFQLHTGSDPSLLEFRLSLETWTNDMTDIEFCTKHCCDELNGCLITKWLSFLLLQKPIYWKRHG